MEQSLNLSQNVDTLFSNIENFTHNEGVIGKPVTHLDKTFIPIVSVSVGCGGGNTSGKSQQGSTTATQGNNTGGGNMSGGALGLGARVSTDAVIVIDKGNVSMMTISAVGNASQIIDKIPEIVKNMNQNQNQQ